MGDPPIRGETSGGAIRDLDASAARSKSFAEFVSALNRLNGLESALATAIARTRIPVQEVRGLLRAQTPDQAENAPAFQFLREVFAQVGIPLAVAAVSRFSWTFRVDESPYARLFAAGAPRRTCGFVSEALARFLAADLDVASDVEEVACRNEAAPACLFAAALDPDRVRRKVLDRDDWLLVRALDASRGRDAVGMPEDEWDFRMERLVGYGLAGADGRLLPEGEELARAGPPPIREEFAPPWEDVSRLTDAIADAMSAAEALVEVAPRELSRDVRVDAETAALAAECHSFAELLARASKGRSWE